MKKPLQNQSKNANKKAKTNFYNSVNSTMNNFQISAKKKFSILNKLLRKFKSSTIPPLIENDRTVTDSKEKSDILNNHFADKASVDGHTDTPPKLDKIDTLSQLDQINTSPIEVGKLIRDCKKTHQSYCGVTGKFLSFISTPIVFALSRMFSNMLEIGFFPDSYKLAHMGQTRQEVKRPKKWFFFLDFSLIS